jgi:glycosyltransferase involved in cell wall biosynthesis
MKILQVIAYFTLRRGGDVNVCYNISRQLAIRGHEVTIITTDLEFDNDYADKIRQCGVKVIPFRCIANINMFLISPSIKKWLNTNIYQYNVIHLHNYRSYQNNVIHYYAKKFSVPYVLQAHGSMLHLYAKQNLKILYDLVWGKSILRDVSKAIALHNAEADQYIQMGVVKNKIEVIPNGIDLAEYKILPNRGQFKNRYHIKDNEKVILYLGRLHKTKGIGILIDSYAEVIKTFEEAILVIVGPDDGYLATLRKQITGLSLENKVIITGSLHGYDKLMAYVDADVFVTPSYSGLPVTFIESCACGLPIIITTHGDKINWINNVGLVTEYDKHSICQAILKILQDNKLYREFSNNGKYIVQYELNWDMIVDKIEKLYANV